MLRVNNLTKKATPRIPYKNIKEKILGAKYELSLVLAGEKLMANLNKIYRQKTEAASALSFPLSKKEGEIFLNINNTRKEILFLFIHSLLHLKGLKHGKYMEQKENLYYNKSV
ncbi:rRNA maturation RNAse YbeY [Patescibacteria group bacterium]|nr:rRNA maturation RNAse YbeY [Patescibacteria group bacterium]